MLLLPVTAALYANSLHGAFHYDDRHTILDNKVLQTSGLEAVVSSAWWGSQAWVVGGGHYRPLTFATYALNYAAGGLDPFGYHVANVLLHWAATAVLMAVIWVVVAHPVPAIVAGMIFAVTPANSEAVNYLAARSSLLASLWYGAAVIGFVLFRRSQSAGRVGRAIVTGSLALLGLLLGLASKEIVATAPLLWLCYDLGWSRKAGLGRIAQPYLIGVALLVSYLLWTGYHHTIWAALTGDQPGMRHVGANAWTQIALVPAYLALFIWPFDLSAFHDVPVVALPWHLSVLWGVLVWGALIGLGLRGLLAKQHERRASGFFLLWFVVALLPTMFYPLNVVFQEHRAYLPGMGLIAAASVGLRRAWHSSGAAALPRRAAPVGFALLVGVLVAGTFMRNAVWRDEMTLWTDAVAKAPGSPVPHVAQGAEYARLGDAEGAVASYRRALELAPDYRLAHFNLGTLHYGRGEYAQAREPLERAVGLDPEAIESLVTLALVYDGLGETERADAAFKHAVALAAQPPERAAERLAVADALAKSARWRDAGLHYQRVLDAGSGIPGFLRARAYLGLGFLAERAGNRSAALAHYQDAIRLDARLNDAQFNGANLLLAGGRWNEATAAYERLLADDPTFFPARFNLGRLYERAGRVDEARAQYRAFLQAAPPSPAYAAARRVAATRLSGDGT
jgi:tetratricopeptide (TPR) repeat protein